MGQTLRNTRNLNTDSDYKEKQNYHEEIKDQRHISKQRHKDAPVKTFKTTTIVNITAWRQDDTTKGKKTDLQRLQTCKIKHAKLPPSGQKQTVGVTISEGIWISWKSVDI